MSLSDEQRLTMGTREKSSIVEEFLREFFGVSRAEVLPDGQVKCTCDRDGLDGMEAAQRWCYINPATPEHNLVALTNLRAWQQAVPNRR